LITCPEKGVTALQELQSWRARCRQDLDGVKDVARRWSHFDIHNNFGFMVRLHTGVGAVEILMRKNATGTLGGKFTQTSRIEIKTLLKTKGL
jgi:hypothetical protein